MRYRLLVIGAFAVWVGCAAIRFCSSPPLGHDEAQYALAARDRVEGQPRRWIYVSVGMEVVGAPGVLVGGSDGALRVLPALLGLAFLVAAWRLAAVLGGDESAAWAVAVIAGTTPLSRFQIDLMSDLPAAACLLAVIAVLAGELRREGGPRWRTVAVAPLAAAALYVRYGSCVPLAIIAVATVAFAGRALVRWPVVVAAALFALLLRPSLVRVLLVSSTVPPPGGGLAAYAAHPFAYLGALAVPLAVLALAGAWRDRWWLYATLIAVADIVALGLETHAQSRYIAVATVLLVAVGAAVARELGGQLAGPVRRTLAGVCAVAVIGGWGAAIRDAAAARERREAGMRATLVAAPAIAHDARGRPCTVIGRHAVQLEWYSGCHGPGPRTYVVRDDTGGPDQPEVVPGVTVLHRADVAVIRASTTASADRADRARSRGRSPAPR